MEDMLVFLQEKDQKYSLLSLDQKVSRLCIYVLVWLLSQSKITFDSSLIQVVFAQAPVIRLKNLMVREVAIDPRAIFLVSTSQEGPEMYEIVCESPEEKTRWVRNIEVLQICLLFIGQLQVRKTNIHCWMYTLNGLIIIVYCGFQVDGHNKRSFNKCSWRWQWVVLFLHLFTFYFSKGVLLLDSASHVSQAIDDNTAQRQRYFNLYIRFDSDDSLIRTASNERKKIIIRRANFLNGKY